MDRQRSCSCKLAPKKRGGGGGGGRERREYAFIVSLRNFPYINFPYYKISHNHVIPQTHSAFWKEFKNGHFTRQQG